MTLAFALPIGSRIKKRWLVGLDLCDLAPLGLGAGLANLSNN